MSKTKSKKKDEDAEEEVVVEEEVVAKTVEEQRDEYLAGWKRALADYENLKKDLHIQKQHARESITADLAQAYLPILDHLQQATKKTPDIPEVKEWFAGVGFIAQQCADVLKEFGVETIDATGEFDPALHEAVSTETDESLPDNAIIKQAQVGFKLKERVLRPAKVIVNKLETK